MTDRPTERGCRTCVWAQWQHTKTGRISRMSAGQCTFDVNTILRHLPTSVRDVNVGKWAIWYSKPNEHSNCPQWRAK